MATDERNRILGMVESGQISAAQAAQLLDALVMQLGGKFVLSDNRPGLRTTVTIPVQGDGPFP